MTVIGCGRASSGGSNRLHGWAERQSFGLYLSLALLLALLGATPLKGTVEQALSIKAYVTDLFKNKIMSGACRAAKAESSQPWAWRPAVELLPLARGFLSVHGW